MSQALLVLVALVIVVALIGAAAWLVRRFAGSHLGSNAKHGRMPRLAVIDAAAVDGRRRLVLVRRDNVEHLLMIGGPTDIVIEPNILRGVQQRDQAAPPRPAEPTPRLAPEAPAWSEAEPPRVETFEHREPVLPEPPPRPTRPFSEDLRRPAAERPAPLPSFTPEPLARPEPPVRSEPPTRPLPRSERLERTEPVLPRLPRDLGAKPAMPRPVPRPGPSVPPAEPVTSPVDQKNLADMAQQLEAALRRPSAEPRIEPRAETREPRLDFPEPRPAATSAPAPEAPQADAARSAPAAAPASKPAFESLEEEMASLLGRSKPSS